MTDYTSMSMRNVLEIITGGNYASDFKIQILKGFMDETDLNDKGVRNRDRKRESVKERERKREGKKGRERYIKKESVSV